MVILGQIVKHIPKKLIEKLKNKYKIQTRSFSATSHVVVMLFAQLSHALSLNDIQDCLRFHKGYLAQIRDCTPIRPGEIVVFDKAYVDFAHLWHLNRRGVNWITRLKENLCFEVMGQQPIVFSDCRIKLTSENTFAKYPAELRKVDASCR